MRPHQPIFTVHEADTEEEILDFMDEIDRNDFSITAVPVTSVLKALGVIESDEEETIDDNTGKKILREGIDIESMEDHICPNNYTEDGEEIV